MTEFRLWLDPDVDESDPKALLSFALDSIRDNPDLAWNIYADDGHLIAEGVRGEPTPAAEDPLPAGYDQWLAVSRVKGDVGGKATVNAQIEWYLRAITAPGADVSQRHDDLESLAELIIRTRGEKVPITRSTRTGEVTAYTWNGSNDWGYGVMPIDTDVHGPECIVCRGEEDFTMNPPGRSRDGHPYIDLDTDEYRDKLLIELPEGAFYIGPFDKGVRLAKSERFHAEGTTVRDGKTVYVVHLADDPDPSLDDFANVAEFGVSARNDREEAWRYALGAIFGPIDAEYDEDYLRKSLDQPDVRLKPEFEYLIPAIIDTWEGATREDLDANPEYLRGQVGLLLAAGAVDGPEGHDSDDKSRWLTQHLIERITNTKENA